MEKISLEPPGLAARVTPGRFFCFVVSQLQIGDALRRLLASVNRAVELVFMSGAKTFREAVCEELGLPQAAYEKAVLWQCLPPRHLPVARLRFRFDRAYFKNDLELIRSIADCTSLEDVRAELSWHRSNKPNTGFQRGILRARLSGQRLVNFAGAVFSRT